MHRELDPKRDFGKTPRQLADQREAERVAAGDHSDPTSHLPQADRQVTRPIQGYAPHYSLGEALMQEEALAAHSRNPNPVPVKQARQSQYPDRARRIEHASALEARQAAEKAEREKAGM